MQGVWSDRPYLFISSPSFLSGVPTAAAGRGTLPAPQPDHRSQQPLAEGARVTDAWSSLGCCSSFCPRAQEASRILLASQDLGELERPRGLGRPRGQEGRPAISTGASYLFKGLFLQATLSVARLWGSAAPRNVSWCTWAQSQSTLLRGNV